MALPEEDLHALKELKSRMLTRYVPMLMLLAALAFDPVAASLMQKKTAPGGSPEAVLLRFVIGQ